jgi:hypothetical protein
VAEKAQQALSQKLPFSHRIPGLTDIGSLDA